MFRRTRIFLSVLSLFIFFCPVCFAESTISTPAHAFFKISSACIDPDGTFTAEFEIAFRTPPDPPTAYAGYNLKYEGNYSCDFSKLVSDSSGLQYYDFYKSQNPETRLKVSGKLSNISDENDLGYLTFKDSSTSADSLALPLKLTLSTDPVKFTYTFDSSPATQTYLYWNSDDSNTLPGCLSNGDDFFNPKPAFWGKTIGTPAYSQVYQCENREITELQKENHGKNLSLYYAACLISPGPDYSKNPDVFRKYPTQYILRDLAQSPLQIPNEPGKNTVCSLQLNTTDRISHSAASIFNNSAGYTLSYQWTLTSGSSTITTSTDTPDLSPACVSGVRPGNTYEISCAAVIENTAGKADSLTYSDKHEVTILAPVPTATPVPTASAPESSPAPAPVTVAPAAPPTAAPEPAIVSPMPVSSPIPSKKPLASAAPAPVPSEAPAPEPSAEPVPETAAEPVPESAPLENTVLENSSSSSLVWPIIAGIGILVAAVSFLVIPHIHIRKK